MTRKQELTRTTKPSRRRKWLRWLAVPLAVGMLALVYQLTRPPELVWWKSEPIEGTNRRIRCRVPLQWEFFPVTGHNASGEWVASFQFHLVDRRPSWIRWLFRSRIEDAWLSIGGMLHRQSEWPEKGKNCSEEPSTRKVNGQFEADRWFGKHGERLETWVWYVRQDRRAFNRTYKQICDSLTIE